MFRPTQLFRFSRQMMSPARQSATAASAPGMAAALEAAQQQAQNIAKRKPDNAFTVFRNVAAGTGAFWFLLPDTWLHMYQFVTKFKEDPERNHGQANKWQEHVRGARRSSLKEYKQAYYGNNQKIDEPDYTPGAYWDRFNNTTIVEQKFNPNIKKVSSDGTKVMKKKKSVGIYDTTGAVDSSRSSEGNEYKRKRSQTYMKPQNL